MPILSEKSGGFRLIRRIRGPFLGHSNSLLSRNLHLTEQLADHGVCVQTFDLGLRLE